MDPYENSTGYGIVMFLYLALLVVVIVGMWKTFEKAGKPGWAAIIPIYNLIVLLEIVGKPLWWIVLLLIPFVNIIFAIIVCHQLSLSFGQGIGMTLLLILLPFVAYLILGFGDARYVGPGGTAVSNPV
ncbi:MAG TPA: DUF5684 domain-containing protein [Cyclobacteriaceae bacterium]|jgi:hypothetical protein